jgi:hypothetical protein
MDPLATLLELGERCRLVLRSADFSIRRQFAEIHQEIDYLRTCHPHLTRNLESLYRDAHPGHEVTTVGLISFAYEQNLRLDGEPYPG